MSVFNIKSTQIANRDATPKVLTDSIVAKGTIRESLGVEKTGNAIMDVASVMRLCSVPSRARLSSLDYMGQSLGTSVLDIAAWYPTNVPQGGGNFLAASVGGTLISSSAFAANINIVDASLAWTDGMGLPSVLSIPKRSQPLWQMLGLTADPEIDIDLGFTVRTATSIQGYVGLRARFVD
jgi:hypothetical protein